MGERISRDQSGAQTAMKKILIPLSALLLLPASYPVQKPPEVVENVGLPDEEPIQHQTQEPEETVLYFPDYVDGGGWSVQLALSNVDPDAAAEVVVEVHGEDGARSWICSIWD